MRDRVLEDAERLEVLIPRLMRVLFQQDAHDPLGHLTNAQLRLIRMLHEEPLSITKISSDLGTTVSAVSQTAGKLARMGLVERQLDPQDRRVRRLSLTDLGQRVMAERRALRVQRALTKLNTVPTARSHELVESLEALLEAFGISTKDILISGPR